MKKILYILVILFCFACSKAEEQEQTEGVFPGLFNLIYPENGSACFNGTVINDNQSEVVLYWGASDNANLYEINVINLNDNFTQKMQTRDESLEVVLKHGEPYAWSVTSFVNSSTSITSKEWKFYLAGDGIVNYAPFPPELISPRPSGRVTINSSGQVLLSWTSSDVDGDLSRYELYLDKNDGTTLIQTFDEVENTVETGVNVDPGFTYFWKIIAKDSNGNSSSSGVYSFVTE